MHGNACAQFTRTVAIAAIGLVALLAWPGSDEARSEGRINAARNSCAAVKATIDRHGAAIVWFRSPFTGNAIYDRYVAHRGFCQYYEQIEYRSVKTRDTNRCLLQRCKRPFRIRDR